MSKVRSVLISGGMAVLLLWVMHGAVHAADDERQYGVRAFSKVESCDGLNRAVTRAKKQDDWSALYGYSLYMMGYLTGINRLAFDTYDIGGRKNNKTLMVWLEKYCAAHPEDSFAEALLQLTVELYPVRRRTSPEAVSGK